jgi:ribonuclease HI
VPVTILPDKEQAIKAHDAIARGASNDPTHLLTYTDGSHIDGWVAAAACARSINRDLANFMGSGHISNIAAAEVRGLALAALIASYEDFPPKKLTIFTDSQAAIQAAKRPRNQPGQYLLRELWWLLLNNRRRNTEVHIHWVPSHRGIEGNDKVAKEATASADTPTPATNPQRHTDNDLQHRPQAGPYIDMH